MWLFYTEPNQKLVGKRVIYRGIQFFSNVSRWSKIFEKIELV